MRGEEKVLEQLSEQCNLVSVQTAWKLEPLQCFVPPDVSREDATTSIPAAGTVNIDDKNPLETTQCPDNSTGDEEAKQGGVVAFSPQQLPTCSQSGPGDHCADTAAWLRCRCR